MLIKTEMEFWRISAGKSKRDSIRSHRVRKIMEAWQFLAWIPHVIRQEDREKGVDK